jgi:hypothetical protein
MIDLLRLVAIPISFIFFFISASLCIMDPASILPASNNVLVNIIYGIVIAVGIIIGLILGCASLIFALFSEE